MISEIFTSVVYHPKEMVSNQAINSNFVGYEWKLCQWHYISTLLLRYLKLAP